MIVLFYHVKWYSFQKNRVIRWHQCYSISESSKKIPFQKTFHPIYRDIANFLFRCKNCFRKYNNVAKKRNHTFVNDIRSTRYNGLEYTRKRVRKRKRSHSQSLCSFIDKSMLLQWIQNKSFVLQNQ